MIEKLDHTNLKTAEKIRSVFRVSYAVEARLIKAVDFPPLKRSLESFLGSTNEFYAYMIDKEIAGAMEIDASASSTHIQSLVVHPDFFRQGIASSLIEYVFNHYNTENFTVETGLENGPATSLYMKFGFKEVRRYKTDHGIRKIRFSKSIFTR
ncbi:MAG: GNAT family N-acetyltransferase [Flavobacteriaceae bacterium]